MDVRRTDNSFAQNSNRFKNICLLIIVLCLSVYHAGAQTSILTPLSLTAQQLNSEQTIRYNKVLAQNMHANYQFVHVEPIAAAQLNGKIAVSFTNAPCPVTYFNAENVEYDDNDSNYTWYGGLSYDDSASDCDLGSAMILARNGQHFGQIRIQDRVFEIIELTGNIQLIAEINTNAIAAGSCGLARTTGTTATSGGVSSNFCKIRVLVLYTPAAKASEASISNRIDLAISQTQQAMLNSDVLPENLNLELAGKQEVDYNEAPYVYDPISGKYDGGVLDDLSEMRWGTLRTQVDHYRVLYQADVVLILVKPNFSDRTNGVSILQSAAEPFGVVQSAIATGVSYTFAHELGHILGADHEDNEGESSDPSTRINSAHAHILHFKTTRGFWPFKRTYDNSQKTLVYGGSGGDPSVILNYSNPYVYHSSGSATGKTTSVLGARNAARHLKSVACDVAAYIPYEPGEFKVRISGPFGLCIGYSGTITSNVSGPAGTYAYEWFTSTDGINYSGVMGTGSSITFTMPAGTYVGVFWKLKCTSPSGDIFYATYAIKRRQSNCTGRFTEEMGTESQLTNKMELSPVPAAATVVMDVSLAKATETLTISLYEVQAACSANCTAAVRRQGPAGYPWIFQHFLMACTCSDWMPAITRQAKSCLSGSKQVNFSTQKHYYEKPTDNVVAFVSPFFLQTGRTGKGEGSL